MSNTILLNIKTLTPIHIGSGRDLGFNFDYLKLGNEAVVTDSQKILQILGDDNIDHWINAIDNGTDLKPIIEKRKPNLVAGDIAQRIIKIIDGLPDKKPIKEQLHLGSPQQPIIPGSSIKGSIRTAILTKLIENNPEFASNEKNLKTKRGDKFVYSDSSIQQHYLAPNDKSITRPEPRTDLLRLLRIGDAYFDTQTCVVQNNIINLLRNSWGIKTHETSYWECIPKDATTTFSLQMPTDLIKQMGVNGKLHNSSNELDIHTLFKTINNHTLDLIAAELDFWEGEENPLAIGDYTQNLNELLKLGEGLSERACIIRVGASNGWDFMTGAWTKNEEVLNDESWFALVRQMRNKGQKYYSDDVPYPKTRKLLLNGMPLGFLHLSLNSRK